MTNIQVLCESDGVCGRGGGAQAVMASDSHGTAAEGHVKIDFSISVVAAATVIWQAW